MLENRPSVFLTLWDSTVASPEHLDQVYTWNGYAEKDSVHSLLRYIDTHGERLRRKYLGFIHDLGDVQIKGKRLAEHLDVGNGLSLWWMSLLAEKSPFKSHRVLDCLRLFALEELLLELHPSGIRLVSADKELAEAIKLLCKGLNIKFQWQVEKRTQSKSVIRRFYHGLPNTVQALIYLIRHLIMRWPLRKSGIPNWYRGDRVVFFLSYFFHLEPKLAMEGEFYPRQWEALPKFLHENGVRTNFVHHFLYSPDIQNTHTAVDWIRRFNKNSEQQGVHTFLDSFLSFRLVSLVFIKWIRLSWIAPGLRQIRRVFKPKDSIVSLWPLLRQDWKTSVLGSTAMMNLMWVELFNAAMKSLPHQRLGLYLCENQGWERAFISAWRKHGHGTLIAVPHSIVRFWHLSYFNDPRTLESRMPCAIPLPDKVAVNGKMAWNAYVNSGYCIAQLLEVEALRYQYLNKFGSGYAKKLDCGLGYAQMSAKSLPKKVLILGDFTVTQTVKMLGCVEAAMLLMDSQMAFTLKSHPVCKVSLAICPTVPLELTNKPLSEIVKEFDVAFSSNTTSAGLDAHLAGLPVVVFLDGSDFNFSPLRGVGGVRFVSTHQELATALQASEREGNSPAPDDFFWLDSQMPKWRQALSEAGVTC